MFKMDNNWYLMKNGRKLKNWAGLIRPNPERTGWDRLNYLIVIAIGGHRHETSASSSTSINTFFSPLYFTFPTKN